MGACSPSTSLFFASTSTKLLDGGWFPLLIAFVIAFLMLTWRKGEEVMDKVRLEIRERSSQFVARLRRDPPLRIPGTAIVLGRMTKGVPLALSHNVNCNRILHEHVLLGRGQHDGGAASAGRMIDSWSRRSPRA